MNLAATLSPDGTKLVVTWQPITGAKGFQFLVDGKAVSHTLDGTRTSTSFGVKAGTHTYGVDVLASGESGTLTWPTSAPPPPVPAPSPQLLFYDDFETGDLSKWDGVQQFTVGRGKVVTGSREAVGGPPAARVGSHYFESEVHSGDNVYGGERCEALKTALAGMGVNGVEQWTAWSVWIPKSLPISAKTGLVGGQFHSGYDYGQSNQFFVSPSLAGLPIGTAAVPHLAYGVSGGPLAPAGEMIGQSLDGIYSKAFDLGPLAGFQGGWLDVMQHFVWKDDPTGTFELFVKWASESVYRTLVSRVGNIANKFVGKSAYLKLGQNRIQSSGLGVGFCWYDNVKIGATRADVTA